MPYSIDPTRLAKIEAVREHAYAGTRDAAEIFNATVRRIAELQRELKRRHDAEPRMFDPDSPIDSRIAREIKELEASKPFLAAERDRSTEAAQHQGSIYESCRKYAEKARAQATRASDEGEKVQ